MPHESKTASKPLPWSRIAIASAILAVLGFFSLWIVVGLFLAAAGAVCGHVARHETDQREMKGRRLALLGLIVGYGSMLLFPFFGVAAVASVVALPAWKDGFTQSQREQSQDRAARLYLACEEYSRANRGRYPEQWRVLAGGFIGMKELRETLQSPYPGGREIAFEIVPHERPVLDAIAESVIVIQEIAPREVDEIAVVYANGKVASIYNPDFQE